MEMGETRRSAAIHAPWWRVPRSFAAAGYLPGARESVSKLISLLGKRGQLLAAALATDARSSFVYERGFRGCRARLYDPDALLGIAGLDPDEHYRGGVDARRRPDGR